MKYYNRFITPKSYIIADNENLIINQVKAIIQKEPIKDFKISGKILVTGLWLLMFVLPIIVVAFYYIKLGKTI